VRIIMLLKIVALLKKLSQGSAPRNRGKFPGGGSQGLENVIQARDGGTHP
jgi:hypothetical protein